MSRPLAASARSPGHHRQLTIRQSAVVLRDLPHNARPAAGLRLPLPALLQPDATVGQFDDRRHAVPRGRRPVLLELYVPEVQPVALPGTHQVPAYDVPARVLGPDLAAGLVVREP